MIFLALEACKTGIGTMEIREVIAEAQGAGTGVSLGRRISRRAQQRVWRAFRLV